MLVAVAEADRILQLIGHHETSDPALFEFLN